MYKIYINTTPIFLTNPESAKEQNSDKFNLVAKYINRKQTLFQYIDLLEKSDRLASVTLFSDDVEQLKEDFFSIYKIIPAAGGAVFNAHEELLMIYRLGFWDLPKGKIDLGETTEAAAIREVQEETGLQELDIIHALPTTYHTYRNKKDVRCLKPTYWYKMKTNEYEITVQTEEAIEKGVWVNPTDFLKKKEPIYGSILDTIKKC